MKNSWNKIEFSRNILNHLPDDPGIYMFLIEKPILGIYNKDYVYIGKAKDQSIKARVKQHFNTLYKSDLYRFILNSIYPVVILYRTFEIEKINNIEKILIKELKPELNIIYNYGGK